MFDNQYQQYLSIVESELERAIPKQDEKTGGLVIDAARYSLLSGGKRIRPVLVLSTLESLSHKISDGLPYACAIEMIHTYSLIHDDLPCMDDDDFRRGRPTCHRQFSEAIAVLAGDTLLSLAFETMLGQRNVSCTQSIEAMKIIAGASGSLGMIGGQTLDISAEGKKISEDQLKQIHSQKTGALILAPVLAACAIANATPQISKLYEQFAKQLGLAFQIQDDILDVTASQEKLGKTVGKDARDDKSTYVSLYGIEQASQLLAAATKEAISALCKLETAGKHVTFLKELTQFLLKRDH